MSTTSSDDLGPLKGCMSCNKSKGLPKDKKFKVFNQLHQRLTGRKRKAVEMGPVCTKKAAVDCDKGAVFSPRGRSNKVSPFVSPVHQNNPKTKLSVDVDEISLGSRIALPVHAVEQREKERVAAMNTMSNSSSVLNQIPRTIQEELPPHEQQKENEQTRLPSPEYAARVDSSAASSSTSCGSHEESGSNYHISFPNLRTSKLTPFKRVNRSCSQGDAQLKKSFGSTDLLGKAAPVLKPDHLTGGVNINRHHSVENVLNIERRKKKTPTKENGIHNLEADQVNYYHLLEEIGRGSFGSIYSCHSSKDNKNYAMKVISKRRLMRKSGLAGRRPSRKHNPLEPLHREIAILKKMDHPNIVKLVEVMDDVQVDNVYMVFELMKNGVVIEVPTDKPIPEERARRLFQELLLGIEYLHYSKIIHRDIKPANLLLDDNDRIKIADFGVSDMFEGDNDLLSKYAGSPAFQSPEVINRESRDKYSGKAADVWAMGVTLFCFLYGKCPFYSSNMGDLVKAIKEEPLTFPETPVINPQAQDLISRMLAKVPKERITVVEMKEHHWVTDGGRTLLPPTEAHCSVIEVTDEEVKNSVKIISKLSSLVFAKSILKGRSFVPGRPKSSWKRNMSLPTPEL